MDRHDLAGIGHRNASLAGKEKNMKQHEVLIIGAGPYGLSIAAHLRKLGIDTAVFGEPMSFWDQRMPRGMFLRSAWSASQLSDPDGKLTLDHYRRSSGQEFGAPIPIRQFVEYGRWFQRTAVPDLDRRSVLKIERKANGFQAGLSDGEIARSRLVIVAAGTSPFARRIPALQKFPHHLVSHSSERRDLESFRGFSVLVVGGGQSALESAALLHEAGANVQVAVRANRVHWLGHLAWIKRCHSIERLLFAKTDVGPAGISHVVARPQLFRELPLFIQRRLAARAIRPAGAAWLKPRIDTRILRVRAAIAGAEREGDRLTVQFQDGSKTTVDHVLLATGYNVDIAQYPFLSPLLSAIRRVDGYPELDTGFECSVRGLHFVGAPAALSFGPLMRFVAGADYTARAIARAVLHPHKDPGICMQPDVAARTQQAMPGALAARQTIHTLHQL
ncbi:MAG: NAD(P)/FAD-dependent oxidoreductase [Acidobacteria bacterium]|nr:NAD(P)/FAD-dependent oxidoreductase [Acidobacteriota bacterium]